jgi:hypothetical protein
MPVTDEKQTIDVLLASWPGLNVSSLELALERLRKVSSLIQEAAQQQAEAHQGEAALIGLADRAYWVLIAGIRHLAGC